MQSAKQSFPLFTGPYLGHCEDCTIPGQRHLSNFKAFHGFPATQLGLVSSSSWCAQFHVAMESLASPLAATKWPTSKTSETLTKKKESVEDCKSQRANEITAKQAAKTAR